jgi:GNAT superfamily N-acetyltransferase
LALTITARDPTHVDAVALHRALIEEASIRYTDQGGLPASNSPDQDLRPPNGQFLVVYKGGVAAGCGGIRQLNTANAEIKRMYVAVPFRRQGIGRRILHELERIARQSGSSAVRLDTADRLTEAISLYRSEGFLEVPRYNENLAASHWFSKPLRAG